MFKLEGSAPGPQELKSFVAALEGKGVGEGVDVDIELGLKVFYGFQLTGEGVAAQEGSKGVLFSVGELLPSLNVICSRLD